MGLYGVRITCPKCFPLGAENTGAPLLSEWLWFRVRVLVPFSPFIAHA